MEDWAARWSEVQHQFHEIWLAEPELILTRDSLVRTDGAPFDWECKNRRFLAFAEEASLLLRDSPAFKLYSENRPTYWGTDLWCDFLAKLLPDYYTEDYYTSMSSKSDPAFSSEYEGPYDVIWRAAKASEIAAQRCAELVRQASACGHTPGSTGSATESLASDTPHASSTPDSSDVASQPTGKTSFPAQPPNVRETKPAAEEFVFVRDGDGYYVAGFGKSGHFTALKGHHYIHRLLRAPGKAVPMAELIQFGESPSNAVGTPRGDLTESELERLDYVFGNAGASDDDDDVVDNDYDRGYEIGSVSRQAMLDSELPDSGQRLPYRDPRPPDLFQRWKELPGEIDKAKKNNDLAEQQRLEEEKQGIVDYLRSSTGKFGQIRDFADDVGKMRSAIRNCLNLAFERLGKADMQEVAGHLQMSIRAESGAYVYSPPEPKPSWKTKRDSQE